MTRGKRTVAYDTHLGIEAFRFSGFDKPFLNHVHDHYVFGFVKQGKRRLACGGIEYEAHPGDLLLFNLRKHMVARSRSDGGVWLLFARKHCAYLYHGI